MQKQEILNYLKTGNLPEFLKNPVELEELSGGLANHVWKIQYPDSSVVLKQYTAYLKYNPNIKLSENRSLVEWESLSAAYKLAKNDKFWTVPKPLFYDSGHHVIFMEYFHCTNLFSLLSKSTDISGDLNWISDAIQSFINDLGGINVPAEVISDTPVVRYYRNDQKNIPERLSMVGIPALEIEAYFNTVRNEVTNTVIFGDLWPASVLVDIEHRKIVVVDWEACRFGYRYNDFVQFLGNLYLMMNGEPFHNQNCKLLFDLILQRLPDKSQNTKLRLLDMIVSLSQYDHWKIPDLKSTLKKAVEINL
ncbi:hypothetical protein HK103_001666 [Boothiomyces macroporosus]|uniref:Aminoglycoside phosphotransferase domain-containing protein n=1 Tax=Boothiomyces macroporosus TaxID=261099 RepID=A0AAD5UE33_9FUNG|nr:hypothetical protein HK103_001666 [Boothiomyces macroporosus]